MNQENRELIANLIHTHRWGALATLDESGAPYGAMVAYVPEADFNGFLIHVSRLGQHTRDLLRNPAAKKDTWEDIKLLLSEMGLEIPKRN